MKVTVLRGVKIKGEYHRPGTWKNHYEPTIIDVDGRDPIVKMHLKTGALEKLKEEVKEDELHTK